MSLPLSVDGSSAPRSLDSWSSILRDASSIYLFSVSSLRGRFAAAISRLEKLARKRLSFYHIHVLYFVGLCFLGSLLLWSFGTKQGSSFSFLDCFYTVVSAMCLSGLSSIAIEDIPVSGQVLIMLMMTLGGQILVSIVPLLVKKHRYCKIAKKILRPPPPNRKPLLQSLTAALSLRSSDDVWMQAVDRSRQILPEPLRVLFLDHRAISQLTNVVVCYLILVQFVASLVAWISIQASPQSKSLLQGKSISPCFFAIFGTVSAFNNVGFVLSNENLIHFQSNTVLLLDLGLIILLGNTIFPAALRGIIWILHRYSSGSKKEAYKLLLDYPRKYYLHLFPRTATIWLLLAGLGSNSLGVLVFSALDWKNKTVDGLTIVEKLVNGLFQTVNTRSGGMNTLNLVELSQALLFLYCIMMYIRPYPLSLKDEQIREDETSLLLQCRRIFGNDNTLLVLLVIFISISLRSELKEDPRNFNLFAILFEVASAYGCVGLTLGYSCDLRIEPGPCRDTTLSFSGKWTGLEKLYIVAVMFIGRHRDLPFHIDSATEMEKLSPLLSRKPSAVLLLPESAIQPV